jgi:hypothetical protein
MASALFFDLFYTMHRGKHDGIGVQQYSAVTATACNIQTAHKANQFSSFQWFLIIPNLKTNPTKIMELPTLQ